jgi:hypothetical protein
MDMSACPSFTEAAALADFVVSQCCQPETFADNMWLDFERVLRASLEEAKEVFDNRSRGVVSFEIYQFFPVNRRRVNECRFLRVVNQITRVDAYAC